LNEFYQVAFRMKVYGSIEELQVDLDAWLSEYNEKRPHSGDIAMEDTDANLPGCDPHDKEKMIGYEAAA